MWPTSARWVDAVRQSRDVVVTAEVWRQGVTTGVTLNVVDGSVRVDESSKVRRSGSITVSGSSDPALSLTGRRIDISDLDVLTDGSVVARADPGDGLTDGSATDRADPGDGLTDGTLTTGPAISSPLRFTAVDTLTPDTADDFLSPVTADVLVSVGHRYTEGDTELVPVLMGRIETVTRKSLAGAIDLDLSDYSAVLQRAKFVGTWVSPERVLVTSEIGRMVHDVLPWVEVYDLTGTTQQTAINATWEKSRWDAITALAAAAGASVLRPLGRLIIRPVPVGAGSSVWTMDTDTETAIVEDASVALDMSGVYNAVAVSTSNPDVPPVTAVVYQAAGPLRWQDGFKVVRQFLSPVLNTFGPCERTAQSILARSLIYAQKIEPTIIPDPALEAGDVGTVTLPGRDPETRILSGFTVPLAPTGQRMPCVLRTALDAVESTDDLREIA